MRCTLVNCKTRGDVLAPRIAPKFQETLKSSPSRIFPLFLFSLALVPVSFAEKDNPRQPVDEAINQSVRALFKQFETAYNFHQASVVASFFAANGVWKTPSGEYTGPEAIEKRMNSFDFEHWHARDEVITANDIRTPLGGGGLLIAVGVWSNTVQENGGQPISLHGWWNAALLPDGNGSWSIVENSFGISK
jgi:ketosteroid isomerase-like protein